MPLSQKKIAYETGKPIVPIAIGKYKKKMKIVVGEPIKILSNDLLNENKKLMDCMKKMIIANGE